MKIAFVTTQSLQGSTVVGRVLPLAEELAKHNQVFVLGHNTPSTLPLAKGEKKWGWIPTGRDPFTRTPSGKHRQRGFALVLTMLGNAIRAAFALVWLRPDVIIIVKSLPENVLATWLYSRLARRSFMRRLGRVQVVLDVDDFELTANQLTSWTQRAAIHWAERAGSRLAHHIIAATPFLADHFEQLTQGTKKVTMIATGLDKPANTPGELPSVTLAGESASPKANQANEAKSYKLIYAGSLSLSSGHRIDLLPEILELVRREIPNTQLHIHGTGDDVQTLKEMFAEKNLADVVVWHGRFAPPSLRRQSPENFGRGVGGEVYLDPIDNSITARAKSSFRVAFAAADGLPVVTSDIGIRPYLLPESLHARCFARPADPADYAARIIDWVKNPLTSVEQQTMRTHAGANSWLQLGVKYAKIIAP